MRRRGPGCATHNTHFSLTTLAQVSFGYLIVAQIVPHYIYSYSLVEEYGPSICLDRPNLDHLDKHANHLRLSEIPSGAVRFTKG